MYSIVDPIYLYTSYINILIKVSQLKNIYLESLLIKYIYSISLLQYT